MLIAIVSDSHGALDRLDALLNNLRNAKIDKLIHAGDFAVYGVVEILEKYPEVEIWIALGNCDINEEVLDSVRKLPNITIDEVIQTEIDKIKIAASHINGVAMREVKDAQIYCSGHTHRAKAEKKDGRLFLNPGSLMDDGGYLLLYTDTLEIQRKLFNKVLMPSK